MKATLKGCIENLIKHRDIRLGIINGSKRRFESMILPVLTKIKKNLITPKNLEGKDLKNHLNIIKLEK